MTDIPERTEQFDRLRVLSGRHMTSESEDIVQVKQHFEKCEKMWAGFKTGVDALPAAMEPWRKVTSQHENLDDLFDKLEREAKDDLEAVGGVKDESTDICEHIYRLKVINSLFLLLFLHPLPLSLFFPLSFLSFFNTYMYMYIHEKSIYPRV